MNVYRKYPRTPHLPWSRGVQSDDRLLGSWKCFEEAEVVVTEKMDGENTTIYRDHVHARSIDSRHHRSRDWVKQLQGRIGYRLPEGWRLCGENVYAQHSIAYRQLQSYFYLFSVWDDGNRCLSWDETLEWATRLDLPTPRTLFRGSWDERLIRGLEFDSERSEGYVVRTTTGFGYADFARCVAKVVRENHVQSDEHWMHQELVPNGLLPKG